MTEEKKEAKPTKGVSRREFIAGTIGGVVVGAVVGATAGSLGFPKTVTQTVTQTATQTQTATATQTVNALLPTSWDDTADVVIAGAGTTGLSAAIEAINAGAKVIVLEKEGSSSMADSGLCAGALAAAGTSIQQAAGVTDSLDQWYTELMSLDDPRVNPGLPRLLTDNGAAAIDFMTANGVTWASYSPVLDGSGASAATAPRKYVINGLSSGFTAALNKSATSKGATILYNTPLTGLIRDPVNGVVGVTAKNLAGTVLHIKASRAVVLACGDNCANTKMLAQFGSIIPGYLALPDPGAPGDTGDGIIAAMAIGAAPVCLDSSVSLSLLMSGSFDTGEGDTTYGYASNSTNPNASISAYKYQLAIMSYAIYVNSAGQRFTNEQSSPANNAYKLPDQTPFMIFDNQPVKANCWWHVGGENCYINEVLGRKLATQANTLADLATALGIDPSGLQATVTKYNGFVAAGKDTDFNRATLGPGITQAPFYGLKGSVVRSPMSNATLNVSFPDLHVLDEQGNPIPRLYAGGDSGRGGLMAEGGGTHMTWTVVSGRVTGTNAAAETPWS